MEFHQDKPVTAQVFKLTPGDIDHVFRRSGLAGNRLSSFHYRSEQAAVSNPSLWFKGLAESPDFPSIARQLLEPDVKISFFTGGASAAEDQYDVLLNTESGAVLAQFVNLEKDFVLCYFANPESFLEWWTGMYASPGMGEYPTVFEGSSELQVLICALHCIDLYRRFYLESMLDYRGKMDVAVSNTDFSQLLKGSLSSGDKRWLLPTLFELTPGLKSSSTSLQPEHIKKLEGMDFLAIEESIFTLGKRSQWMGSEFISAWMGATGWEATILNNGKEKVVSRVFLAVTALSNHLFSFGAGPEGKLRFRHQACDRAELITSLLKWMDGLWQAVAAPAPTGAATAGETPQRNFCGHCGNKVGQGKKFCGHCGALL